MPLSPPDRFPAWSILAMESRRANRQSIGRKLKRQHAAMRSRKRFAECVFLLGL